MPYSDLSARTEYHKKYNKKYQQSPGGKRVLWEATVRHKFGIEAEDVARAYDRQNKKCCGCLCDLGLGPETHIDHDHATGKFRGLLCATCNQALGLLYDNEETLKRLISYLERSRGN